MALRDGSALQAGLRSVMDEFRFDLVEKCRFDTTANGWGLKVYLH